METNKSRDLTTYGFFQVLQIEYIACELRTRIYPKKKDKEYWNKVKEGKKSKIDSIAEKNHLPTIFTDIEMRRIFELKVYNDKGLPTFTYKDEANRIAQEPLDLIYYFSTGAEVRFDMFGEQKIGKVLSYLPYADTILVAYPNSETSVIHVNVPVKEVTRIL